MFKLDPVINFFKIKLILSAVLADTIFVLDTDVLPKVPDPSIVGEYNGVVWNVNKYSDPSDDPDVEIVRVTAKSDTGITVLRAQENTVASAKETGYMLQITLTEKTINDIDNAFKTIDPKDINYSNSAYTDINSVKDALDDILYFPPQVSLSLSCTPSGNIKEIGQTANDINLSWTLNKDVIYQSIDNGIGNIAIGTKSVSKTGVNISSDTTFTITVKDNKNTVASSQSIIFRNKRWWGISSLPLLSNSADILSLLNSELSTDYKQTKTFDATGGKYIYFAFPITFTGTPLFTVGGFTAPFQELSNINFQNESGYTSTYRVFRSSNLQNDSSITVIVS